MILYHLLHPLILVDLLSGLVTTTVMMITTMRLVAGTVVIAVVIMSIHNIALPVNAWILMEEDLHQHQLQPQLHLPMHVDPLNGLVTTIVMMTTTMKNADGMVEIAVETMSTHNTALLVNV